MNIERGHAVDCLASFNRPLDLLATDPPYAMGGDGAEHAMSATVAVALREAAQKLKPSGWAIVMAASSWRSTFYMVEALRGVVEPVRIATWVKPRARSKTKTAGWCWASVNVIAFRKKDGNKALDPHESLDWICQPPLIVGRRAQLPPEVADWAVGPFSVPGGVMLDPFSGSGALCQAAERAGMEAFGFELQAK